jgi:hypothetical protein
MTAQEAEIQKQQGIAETQLGFAKEQMDFSGDLSTQSFDLFTNLQDRMSEVYSLQLDRVDDEQAYKDSLAKAGFDYITQELANQAAAEGDQADFERQLFLKQYEKELEMNNPEVKSVQNVTDRGGNVTSIVTYSNGEKEVTSLGRIGAAASSGGSGSSKKTTPEVDYLSQETPPDDFIEKLQSELQMTLTPPARQAYWDAYREEANKETAGDYFTTTQIAKGAANSNMSITEFKNLDIDTANSYINAYSSTEESENENPFS